MEAQDLVPEGQAWLHKGAAAGTQRGFITLECTYPTV